MKVASRIISLILCGVSVGVAGPGNILVPTNPVPGQYIVVLDETVPALKQNGVPRVASELAAAYGGDLGYIWENVLSGFTVAMTETQARALAQHPWVRFVEQNAYVELALSESTNVHPATGDTSQNYMWNLDRIDPGTYEIDNTFTWCSGRAGNNVKAYVLDTGILKTHQEFRTSDTDWTSRVRWGTATTTDGNGNPRDRYPEPGHFGDTGTNPCNVMGTPPQNADLYRGGHGTSVASVLGGIRTGVAKVVKLVPVKVIPCVGQSYVSDFLAGLDWIWLDYVSDEESPGVRKPSVVNISIFYLLPEYQRELDPYPNITSSEVTSVELAVDRLIREGLTVVASANNQNQDATITTPARMGYGNPAFTYHTITVGGSMLTNAGATVSGPGLPVGNWEDKRWISPNPNWDHWTNPDPGSNYGSAVDIFAPAHEVTVAHIASTNSYRTQGRTGTSFAAPLASGVAAQWLSVERMASPQTIWDRLRDYAILNQLDPATLNGSPNRLLKSIAASFCSRR